MNATQQPLIGIPSRHDRSGNYRLSPVNAQAEPYLKATVQAGGIPFMIPLNLPRPALRRLYDLADGLMLTGHVLAEQLDCLFFSHDHPHIASSRSAYSLADALATCIRSVSGSSRAPKC